MRIMIFNITDYPLNKKKVLKLTKMVLVREKSAIEKLNIIIVDEGYIRELNKKFLHRDRSTNVLAFNLDDICEIYVSKDAAKDEQELYYYILHGLLHIIGYDHNNKKDEKLMEEKCLDYLQEGMN